MDNDVDFSISHGEPCLSSGTKFWCNCMEASVCFQAKE